MEREVYLLLENGRVFKGKGFGAAGEVTGELVFTTGMTGYLETLTDPSYYGQIVVHTFPLIGNYGIIPADFESGGPHVRAYIVRQWCEHPSNFRCERTLDQYLQEKGVIGMYDLDTRELTKLIREHGVMNARISTSPYMEEALQSELRAYRVTDAVSHVTCREAYQSAPAGVNTKRGVLWDFGAKRNIERELMKRGCRVITVPADTKAEQIKAWKPHGIMLSNGPGDPADNPGIIQELAKLLDQKIPTFGICLGHQLLALAKGAATSKLKYGHRGANQPVKDLSTGRVYITSQNHGYAVDSASLPACAKESFVNVNDGTCEGVRYEDIPAFSVQFHPEACGGPRDTEYLFNDFMQLMERGQSICH